MRTMLIILAAALVALAAGCVSYDERIELNADGSGVVRMHLTISEQIAGQYSKQKAQKEDDLLPVPRKDLVADLEKQGFKVLSLRAESSQGLRHFYIVLEFKNLADIEKSDIFGGRKISLTREEGKFEFRSQIAVSERTLTDRAGGKAGETPPPAPAPKTEPKKAPDGKDAKKDEPYVSIIKQLEMRFGKERVRQMFSPYAVSFSVEMPGATLLKTNGGNYRDAAAIWETPLNKLIETWPTITMEADFAKAPAPPSAAPEAPRP